MSQQSVDIQIYGSVEEAPRYDSPEFRRARIVKVCIVRGGTLKGRSTMDIIFVDDKGQKSVAMLTSRLMQTLIATYERFIPKSER